MGARNTGTGYKNHQSWQGKVYSSEEMRAVCGLGEMLGFAGINCYHIRFPFIPGVSKRRYTDEWLAEQNRKENEKKAYRGKEYDVYGALQYQRKLERAMRKQKQDIALLEKAGADKDDITAAKCRLRLTNQTYVDFSKQMGLRQQRERLKIGEVEPSKEFIESVEKKKKAAIIKSELKTLGLKGKINLEPTKIDFAKLSFDNSHINGERQHSVTFDEAKNFVHQSLFSETVWNGQYERYYSEAGAAYIRVQDELIRTAFKRDEYSENILAALEVVKKYGK